MNLSSLALALLLVASSAADSITTDDARKMTHKLKTRRINANNENMAMNIDENTSDSPLPNWWGSGDKPCVPKGRECDGFSYYQVIDGADDATWSYFYGITPDNCIMAPIHSPAEWDNLYAWAKTINGADNIERNLFVGVVKSAAAVQLLGQDFSPPTIPGARSGWFNFDGTPAAVSNPGVWQSGEPNNNGDVGTTETYLHMKFGPSGNGKLNDIPDGKSSYWDKYKWGAIYQCCDDQLFTFPTSTCAL